LLSCIFRKREQKLNMVIPDKSFRLRNEDVERKWYLVDVENKVLGRVATRIAALLTGKHKPQYTPGVDCGDYVVVINADKVRVTGKKNEQKIYFRHSGYPGGDKYYKFKDLFSKKPEKILELAVKGMLPDNKLKKRQLRRLRIYKGSTHPHQAQQPERVEI